MHKATENRGRDLVANSNATPVIVEVRVTIHANSPKRRSHATKSTMPATAVSVNAAIVGLSKPKRVVVSQTSGNAMSVVARP